MRVRVRGNGNGSGNGGRWCCERIMAATRSFDFFYYETVWAYVLMVPITSPMVLIEGDC